MYDAMSMHDIFYVYILIDPRTHLPFYVGKGTGRRMYIHERDVLRGKVPNRNTFLFNKIRKILSLGYRIIYKKVYENLTEDIAFQKESDEIRKYEIKRVGGILCNLSYGGEGMKGYKFTPKQLKKHKQKMKEVHSTDEARQKNSKSIVKFYSDHPHQRTKLSKIQKRLWASGTYDNSKEWIFLSPKRKCIKFKNLQKFCRENNLSQGNMINVFRGKRNSHKGWKKYS